MLVPFLWPYRGRVLAAVVALLLAAGLVLLLGQGLRHLIDDGFATAASPALAMARLNRAAAVMALVIGALAVATAGRFYLVSWLGERVAGDLRRAVFDRLISLSPAFFETARTGDLLSRLTADTSLIQALVGSAISQWLRGLLMLLGAFAMLLATSPSLTAVVLAVVPLVVVPLILFGRREKRQSRISQDRVADLGAFAEETLNALRTVQAFVHEPLDRAGFAARVQRSVAAALRRVRTRALLILVVILLGFGAITLSLWLGGREVVAGRMTGGELSAFVFYAVLLATSLSGVSELWGELQRAAGAAERLMELLAERPAIAAPARPVALPRPARGHVAFQGVTFFYPARPDRPALRDFGLEVAQGETVALVGPSGSGKTTVFQLLLRFYDPQAGCVRVDDIDIATTDPAELRGRIGLVAQEPVIFSADAWTNIRYGRPDATDAEVRAAARAAAADFLDDLPEGYDTHLGEKGVRLSGGQRQRIAIARAILRDPAILLLDEATSALDAASEQAVQQALARLSNGRTTLVIAHRLATVRRADRIVVLQDGQVVATGTHEMLVQANGLYARLAALQFDDRRAAG
ncbi:ATP-binding cassette domain-containing protein [Rhodovastum atsumiense]|uniref:ATP-binding cassette domain-containing protein n=2 Tax=Rhodovastum atsumiense TaxID=504468 RepID=A0A5M6J3V6_9PROT|nr:ATP-binding cassette domain-containing protein [Rhodovastum atsumiense]